MQESDDANAQRYGGTVRRESGDMGSRHLVLRTAGAPRQFGEGLRPARRTSKACGYRNRKVDMSLERFDG